MNTHHTSEPSKLVIAGSDYHVNSGTIRMLVEQRDELLAALDDLYGCRNLPDNQRIAVLTRVHAAITKAETSVT